MTELAPFKHPNLKPPNLLSSTPLFKGSDVPTKVPRYQGTTLTGKREQYNTKQ